MTKRIFLNQCCGVIIDVQEFFLAQLEPGRRAQAEVNMMGFAKMLTHLRIPTLATLERPIDRKGGMPTEIRRYIDKNEFAEIFEKDYFDLTKEKTISGYMRSIKKKQAIVAGCETDVCVLQSCLGLIDLGYEVFLVEELLFSTSKNVTAAMERLKNAGAISVSLKTLYYELIEAVESSPQRKKFVEKFGPSPLEI